MKKAFWAVLFLVATTGSSLAVTQDQVNAEARRLAQWRSEKLEACRNHAGCVNKVENHYKSKINSLQQGPELYFGRQDRQDVRREVRRELNSRGYN